MEYADRPASKPNFVANTLEGTEVDFWIVNVESLTEATLLYRYDNGNWPLDKVSFAKISDGLLTFKHRESGHYSAWSCKKSEGCEIGVKEVLIAFSQYVNLVVDMAILE